MINEAVLQRGEKYIFSLRELYINHGFTPYRMSKFEEYDLYARNKDFLVSDNVITFTDTDGKLMALKPDVTLSIIKNSNDLPEELQKVYYNENVYRVSSGTGSFKELMQAGVECFGKVSEQEVVDVLLLAVDSMKVLSDDIVLAISNLDLIKKVADDEELTNQLLAIQGGIKDNKEALESITSAFAGDEAIEAFLKILEKLCNSAAADFIHFDFSMDDDVNYYNGIVFKGFIKNVPTAVLSGGQYDNLMQKMRRRSKAIGFAVYVDELDRVEVPEADDSDDYISVALPKGRLGEKVYDLFAKAGYECPSILETNRKLIFENSENKVRYFWVKPSDVSIYVERGAADIGVCGKDILLEYEPDISELLDMNTGICCMAVAAPKGFQYDPSKTLRVATKFAKIAQKFYQSKGRDIDIIHLNGSIELAPLLGLSDVIVDIVETGTTLKENNLEVVEEIVPISARLIANKSALKFKGNNIKKLVDNLSEIV
ncbi:MAG: ATP phosphoribosyltransferase [Lachnospiraceae bacterium]|nr:ATP phosphoribosyltransferase [Lachnospiraceae bacterium]